MSLSEILTIVIHFHQSNHRTFKHYYKDYVAVYLRSDFSGLVSYTRFLELMREVTVPLVTFLINRSQLH